MARCWLLILVMCGCNEIYGLHETGELDAALPDFDGDGVPDSIDNCLDVPNPDQLDTDGDGIGDACDRCPMLASANNHDEDGDLTGDLCDDCPGDPNYQLEKAGDGVGDACTPQIGFPMRRLRFDPFTSLAPSWTFGATRWRVLDDAVAPTAPLAPGEPGLRDPGLVLTGDTWQVDVGFTSSMPWPASSSFGIVFRDATMTIVASALMTCTLDPCQLALVFGPQLTFSVAAEPILRLRVSNVHGNVRLIIDGVGTNALAGVASDVTAELLATPDVHVGYFDAMVGIQ